MDKKGSTFDTSNFQSVIVKDIPQQMNGSDCGMFTCKVIIFSKNVCKNGANQTQLIKLSQLIRQLIYSFSLRNIYLVTFPSPFHKRTCHTSEDA